MGTGSGAARGSARVGPPAVEGAAARRRAGFVLDAMPRELEGYLEPWLDDGAVAAGVLQRHPEAFVTLAAEEADVVAAWQAARDEPEALIRAVEFHAERHSPPYLAAERGLAGERLAALTPLERAARHVYLRGADADAGRGGVGFDPANLRRLSALLRERDVAFAVAPPFELLREVREGDLVHLDPDYGMRGAGVDARLEREVRSFAASATARGALVLAASPRGAEPGLYGAWPGFVRVGAHPGPDSEAVWGNGPLARALRASEDRSGR